MNSPEEASRCLCKHWTRVFRAGEDLEGDAEEETILDHVVTLPEDITRIMGPKKFDEMFVQRRSSALGPDGIPYDVHRSTEDIDCDILFKVYSLFTEGVRASSGSQPRVSAALVTHLN